MLDKLLGYGLQYAGYGLEVYLFVFLLVRGQWRRQLAVSLYVFSLLAIDGVARPFVLYHYGFESDQYAYCYWLSEVPLLVAAFTLVCAFFRRACKQEKKMWQLVRLFLLFVLILIVTISFFSISRNHTNLLHDFIYEFEQNLSFTCLVLNTLLYIMLQQIDSADEELGLLVCGMGIQFAGPAANLALRYIIVGRDAALSLFNYMAPLCTLGMLLIWIYVVSRKPQEAAVALRSHGRKLPALAGLR